MTKNSVAFFFFMMFLALFCNASAQEIGSDPERVTSTNVECAMAITVAIGDYVALYSERRTGAETFPEHFVARFGEVRCVESSEGIRVTIFPKVEGVGGGVDYLVDRDRHTVLRRIPGG